MKRNHWDHDEHSAREYACRSKARNGSTDNEDRRVMGSTADGRANLEDNNACQKYPRYISQNQSLVSNDAYPTTYHFME